MTTTRLISLLTALALLLSACASAGPTESTSESPATTETTQDTPGTTEPPGTPAQPVARTVDLVECDDADEDVAIVCQAYELIQTHYVDEVSETALGDAALQALELRDPAPLNEPVQCALAFDGIETACESAADSDLTSEEVAEAIVAGMAAFALDPNSTYFDEEALANLEREEDGQIEGIGALVTPEDETIEGDNKQCTVVSDTCRIIIVSTIEGAPAEGVGLMRDDVIIGVDGESIDGWTIDEVTSRVRGPAGTDVSLTIDRAGEELNFEITRAAVVIPVLSSDLFGDTGYIRLRVFSDNADEQFEEALLDLLEENIDDLVIDLRGNPGGLLTTAIEITSIFLEEGEVIVTQSPDDERTYEVTGGAIVPSDVRVVFVVDRGSASASEVVSAVLQENALVTVVGENTFGKNTVQQRFNLDNGGALKLTIARWLTPGGLDFGGVGVTPDVELDIDPDIEPEELVAFVLGAA